MFGFEAMLISVSQRLVSLGHIADMLPMTYDSIYNNYCPGLPKWTGTGLLPAWDQKCPLMCAFGTKRRVLVHKKIPNRARFVCRPI